MPHPKEVFDNPDAYWSFLTTARDEDFEGQYFDRKELCQQNQVRDFKKQIQESVSAFSNANKDGGLLVIGISTDGTVKGIAHLTENQFNSLTRLNELLIHHSATTKLVDYIDTATGNTLQVCFVYAAYVERYICETPGNSPSAWWREGRQNISVNDAKREQIKREKGIVDFENTYCCPFDGSELDENILHQFRRNFYHDSGSIYNDEEMLWQAGAIIKTDSGFAFTNAGYLFFTRNPQRVLSWTYIRLLKFGTDADDENKGLPLFEKNFKGSITEQISDIRNLFKESDFFKAYQKRNSSGGFDAEPELPFIAVDEAIVNAVAHRDYAVRLPIEAEAYKNAFLVRNPGRIIQRDHDVPDEFSLQNTRLNSTPRNPKLIEWLKLMKNDRNIPFVKALSEGTQSMKNEMLSLGLPAPGYKTTSMQTEVRLTSNAERREAEFLSGEEDEPTEFANLFPVDFENRESLIIDKKNGSMINKDFMSAFRDALRAKKWYVDRFKFTKIVAHRQSVDIRLPNEVAKYLRFYPAFSFQLRQYKGKYFLSIDYTLEVKNVRTIRQLAADVNLKELEDHTATVFWSGWRLGRILSCGDLQSKVFLFDFDTEETIDNEKIIPNLSKAKFEEVLANSGIKFDLSKNIKLHSLNLDPNASRLRFEKSQDTAHSLAKTIFPVVFKGIRAFLNPKPLALSHRSNSTFFVSNLDEPNVVFGNDKAATDIREGITKFGSFTESPKTLELIPISTFELRDKMASLIERLKSGKYKYRGSERTFHTRFTYNSIVTVPSTESILSECERLLNEHPEWIGSENLNRLFLIHVPERGYSSDDESAPYFKIKRLLLERGIPCQMIDTPTIDNPDWKDLNLALNIVAKCGVTPWVLPDAIPDADFFIGLSYTQNNKRKGERLLGYANVFNKFGNWVFYSGNLGTFSYDDKAEYFSRLVKETLARLTLSETPNIYFHYSAKFSREDKSVILESARRVKPEGTYSFVHINTHHSVRLYDVRPETDGSLSRGAYVVTTPNQFFLSTTGNNSYRKNLGTPQMLEINVWKDGPENSTPMPPDLRSIAVQILSLTKLNWASTDSLCGEPITTKYAGDIAYLTAAFLRQGTPFQLHPVIEKTPWFI